VAAAAIGTIVLALSSLLMVGLPFTLHMFGKRLPPTHDTDADR
jgi:hypothetical protein